MKTRLIILGFLLLGITAKAGTLIQFRTAVGDVQVELYDQEKPGTVQNFLKYVDFGLYRDMFLHRLVERTVLQGGGYALPGRNTGIFSGFWTTPTFPPITNEFNVGPMLSNIAGTIAMAKQPYGTNVVVEYVTNIVGSVTNLTPVSTNYFVYGGPDSAASQFFFNLKDNHSAIDPGTGQDQGLNFNNGGYTVFGRVVAGMGVLDYIGAFMRSVPTDNPINVIVNFTFDPALNSIPLYRPPGAKVENLFTGLVYADITRHNVQVTTVFETQRQIRWNVVNGLTNWVEFTGEFPPVWQTLYADIPATNSPTATVIDPSPESEHRFYRVRVTY